MLNNWQNQAGKYIPRQLPGYEFISRVPVFIPVQTINITVWERKVQSLSFIHECILSSIQIGTKSLSDLSNEFGLPESIMLQIITQLDSEQLAAVSSGSIIITEKGKQALQTQKKTQTRQNYLNRLCVNQITGDITDAPPVGTYHEPPFGKVYLSEEYPVTLVFLRSHFDTIAAIYRESRFERTVFQTNMTEGAELYRILDISCADLSYICEFCFVYLNKEDNSLAFYFESGIQAYADALLEQMNQHGSGARNLLSMPFRDCDDRDDSPLPLQLIEAFSSNVDTDTRAGLIENEYYKNRPLLDGELTDILSNCNDFKADKILIEAPLLDELVDGNVISALLSQHTKEIVIRYKQDNFGTKKLIDSLKSRSKNRKDLILSCHQVMSISSVKIYIGNKCAILGQYAQKDTVYHRKLFKLCASVIFDSEQISNLWNEELV